jgi:hypothetical protein
MTYPLAAETEQALQGVTPGPWKAAYSKWEPDNFIVQTDHPCRRVLAQFDGDGDGPDDQSLADARFIAFARAWVPEAAAALTALSAERDEAVNQLDSARHNVDVLEKRVTSLAAQVAELTRERDALQYAADEGKRLWAAAEAKVARLLDANWKLRSYAVHDNECKVNKPPHFDVTKCSCGLRAALTEGTPE